jgi:hypothetical protein
MIGTAISPAAVILRATTCAGLSMEKLTTTKTTKRSVLTFLRRRSALNARQEAQRPSLEKRGKALSSDTSASRETLLSASQSLDRRLVMSWLSPRHAGRIIGQPLRRLAAQNVPANAEPRSQRFLTASEPALMINSLVKCLHLISLVTSP